MANKRNDDDDEEDDDDDMDAADSGADDMWRPDFLEEKLNSPKGSPPQSTHSLAHSLSRIFASGLATCLTHASDVAFATASLVRRGESPVCFIQDPLQKSGHTPTLTKKTRTPPNDSLCPRYVPQKPPIRQCSICSPPSISRRRIATGKLSHIGLEAGEGVKSVKHNRFCISAEAFIRNESAVYMAGCFFT